MHLMLAQDVPEDFVVGTGVTHSVEELVDAGVRGGRPRLARTTWSATPRSSGRPRSNQPLRRPVKAVKQLGWEPKVGFDG